MENALRLKADRFSAKNTTSVRNLRAFPAGRRLAALINKMCRNNCLGKLLENNIFGVEKRSYFCLCAVYKNIKQYSKGNTRKESKIWMDKKYEKKAGTSIWCGKGWRERKKQESHIVLRPRMYG